jgi:3-oxoadipate enol-lactonase
MTNSSETMTLPLTEVGQGPAVLLLHAGIVHRRMWSDHLEPLAAAGHRVVAIDLPGFGEAPAQEPVAHWEDVIATMDALGIDKAALVGSSFGAAVALRVAALHPSRVSSLALFSAPAVPDGEPSPELTAVWDAVDGAEAAGELDRAVAEVLKGWVRPEADLNVGARVAAMQHDNYSWRGSDAVEFATDPLDAEPSRMAAIECPVLVASGEDGMSDFRDAVASLSAQLPNARSALIPDCGHLAPLEAPAEFRRLVLEHLRRR